METRAYCLHLRSPLHVGDQGIGSEVTHAYVPSDTLFSALAVTWGMLEGSLPPLTELLDENNPPLLLSSAFPFAGKILLLPRPLLPLIPSVPQKAKTPASEPHAAESGKTFRRVRWISQSLFVELLADPTQSNLDALWQAGMTVQGGSVWVKSDEFIALQTLVGAVGEDVFLWSTGIVPRVAVDRISSAGQIHHTGRAGFASGCGLWFLARGESKWLDALKTALAVLGDEGMGGKRSIGSGQFTCEQMEKAPQLSGLNGPGGNYVVLLSRTAPRQEQMALLRQRQAAYDLTLVGGFNGTPGENPLVRRQVRMLAEGSIIGAPGAGEVIGRLVDVTPTEAPSVGHPIWRSGLGFDVGVQLPDAEKEGAR